MDGDIDYTNLSRAQLEEALRRIDRSRFPLNYDHLVQELGARGPALPQGSAPTALLTVIGWHAFSLIALDMVFGFVLLTAQALVLHRLLDNISEARWIVKIVGTAAVTLAVYLHLEKRHSVAFPKAAAGVAIIVSLFATLMAYFGSHEQVPTAMFALATIFALNIVIASSVGFVSRIKKAKFDAG